MWLDILEERGYPAWADYYRRPYASPEDLSSLPMFYERMARLQDMAEGPLCFSRQVGFLRGVSLRLF